jgi:hypothetical protein
MFSSPALPESSPRTIPRTPASASISSLPLAWESSPRTCASTSKPLSNSSRPLFRIPNRNQTRIAFLRTLHTVAALAAGLEHHAMLAAAAETVALQVNPAPAVAVAVSLSLGVAVETIALTAILLARRLGPRHAGPRAGETPPAPRGLPSHRPRGTNGPGGIDRSANLGRGRRRAFLAMVGEGVVPAALRVRHLRRLDGKGSHGGARATVLGHPGAEHHLGVAEKKKGVIKKH